MRCPYDGTTIRKMEPGELRPGPGDDWFKCDGEFPHYFQECLRGGKKTLCDMLGEPVDNESPNNHRDYAQ